MAKIRLFLVERGTGTTVGHAPLVLFRERDSQTDTGEPTVERLPVGLVATDRSGYASVPLPTLNKGDRLVIQPFADPALESMLPNLPEDGTTMPVVLPPGRRIPTPPQPEFLPPGVIDPDGYDRRLSPRSFTSEEALILGEGGCEQLLHSAVTAHTYRFSYLLREPDWTPKHLYRTSSGAKEFTCDDDLPDPGTACWWPGVVLEYEMTFNPVGHALGEMIFGTSLAPCESVNLAVIDWSRKDQIRRSDTTALGESYAATLERDRGVDETVQAMLREWQRGGSIIGGGAAAFPLGQVGAGTAALGGGYATSSGDRSVAGHTAQRLLDTVEQGATSVRRQASTVVLEASQAERDVVETRTVTNHNHCHMLNFLFYEILRHYRVDLCMVNKQDAILVKRPAVDFYSSDGMLHRYREIIRAGLLRPELANCFGALDKIRVAEDRFERRRFQVDPPDYILGRLRIRFDTGTVAPEFLRVRLYLITRAGEHAIPLNLVTPPPSSTIGIAPNELIRIPSAGLTHPVFDVGAEDIVEVEPGGTVRWQNVRAVRFVTNATPLRSGFSYSSQWQLRHVRIETTHEEHTWILWDAPPTGGTLTREPPENIELEAESWGPREARDLLDDDDLDCLHKLREHVREHDRYYSRLVRLAEDPQEWARWLDAVTRHTDGGPRLLDEVENRIAGVVGDWYAFPDTSPIPKGDPSRAKDVADPEGEYTKYIALPTRGVFGEAKLGHCCACERRDPTRYWDWSESPCPEHAPPIEGITPGSRARAVEVAPQALPESGVGPQEVPPAPDPGAMIDTVLKLLATPEIFRDMSAAEQVADVLGKLIEGAVQLAGKRIDTQAQPREESRATQPASSLPIRREQPSPATQAADDASVITQAPGLSEERRGELVDQRMERFAQGDESQRTPSRRLTRPAPTAAGREIIFFLTAHYSNGDPLFGNFEFHVQSSETPPHMFFLEVTPDEYGAMERFSRTDWPAARYAWQGLMTRTQLPDSVRRDLEVPLPGPFPNISIPLTRFITLGPSEVFRFGTEDTFVIDPGANNVRFVAVATIRDQSMGWSVDLTTEARAGLSAEETISLQIQNAIEIALRQMVSLTIGNSWGLAGTIGVNLSGGVSAGVTLNGQIDFQYIDSVVVRQQT